MDLSQKATSIMLVVKSTDFWGDAEYYHVRIVSKIAGVEPKNAAKELFENKNNWLPTKNASTKTFNLTGQRARCFVHRVKSDYVIPEPKIWAKRRAAEEKARMRAEAESKSQTTPEAGDTNPPDNNN